jgi:hypothetical protein
MQDGQSCCFPGWQLHCPSAATLVSSSNGMVGQFSFEECGFYPFFFFPSLHLVLCNYVLDRLVGGFNCLFSFPWFNFCIVTNLGIN